MAKLKLKLRTNGRILVWLADDAWRWNWRHWGYVGNHHVYQSGYEGNRLILPRSCA